MFGIKGMKRGIKEHFMSDKNVRKVFVSLPMRGFEYEAVKNRQLDIFENITSKLNPQFKYELIDTLHENLCPPDDNPLWYLGLSIQQLGEADVVIFSKDWRIANGCRAEHLICDMYGIEYVYEGTEDFYAEDEQ